MKCNRKVAKALELLKGFIRKYIYYMYMCMLMIDKLINNIFLVTVNSITPSNENTIHQHIDTCLHMYYLVQLNN